MGRRLGAVLIALGVVCVLLAFCLDASAAAAAGTGDGSVCHFLCRRSRFFTF